MSNANALNLIENEMPNLIEDLKKVMSLKAEMCDTLNKADNTLFPKKDIPHKIRMCAECIIGILFEDKLINAKLISLGSNGRYFPFGKSTKESLSLFEEIDLLSKKGLIDKDIERVFHSIRMASNPASHGRSNDPTSEEVQNVSNDLTLLVELLLKQYFVGFFRDEITKEDLPIFTLLSALPPEKRVDIFEVVRNILSEETIPVENRQLLVNKLSLAYVKSNNPEKAEDLLTDEQQKNILGNDFINKQQQALKAFDGVTSEELNCSKTLDDVKEKLRNLPAASKQSEFLKIFALLLLFYESFKITSK